ncbi:MurNAc alpha-1-phosphate uridylyltransferase [Litoreibacter ponti]|uniref:MurNAc alpha-1-phosphate uridylyltransferase n=1 Tax=Litoreibacter ponti TaxID=1510457 RepID=A0A2T6BPT7_9RHOB|nr:nucleotidyltransferase family protein [Litoreibacter ponti]PTX58103.1 MurNAc alpha-1-phosphate uridylyltransferase [Litoreibacter ponti]
MDEAPSAMIFAAGFGTRMRPLTDTRPKPLIEVAGRPLLDHALSCVSDFGARAVVNAHYKSQMIAAHLADTPVTVITEAPEVLDTGGGLRNARAQLGSDPVFTMNSDVVWAGPNPLNILAEGWRDNMEALLLLVPVERTVGYTRSGNFSIGNGGQLQRDTSGMVYTGAQLLRTDRLDAITQDIFSLNVLWDQMLAGGAAYGVTYPGHWADVGTPDGIKLAETMLQEHGDV